MCKYVEGKHLMPGWGCCKCHTYCGLQRALCKHCGELHCPLDIGEHVLVAVPKGEKREWVN